MALRYAYNAQQGGWVLDNRGHFQTPRNVARYYGQTTTGFPMRQSAAEGLLELPNGTTAMALGYGRDRVGQCYSDPAAPRNALESRGCPSPTAWGPAPRRAVSAPTDISANSRREWLVLGIMAVVVLLALGAVAAVRTANQT